jgi:predicted phage terminase large subunit-like protein
MNAIEKLRMLSPGLAEKTREKLLGDFASFCRRAWKEIEAKPLDWSWHHQLVAEHLQLLYTREIRRLVISMPPRGLKSRLVSVLFPAWCWAKDPSLSFALTSYSDSLSEELNVIRRNLLQGTWFQSMFPGQVQFAADQNRKEQYMNTARGMMLATSTEGVLLGKGFDFILVDDALSPQQSYSDLERENVNRHFDSTVRSRLNEPERGGIVVIAQRLHERDLIGHILENEPNTWVHVNLPMEAEADEQIVFPVSGKVLERKAGDLLHPARWPAKWCEKQKVTIGSYLWASQFQQRPAPPGGAIFQQQWFQTYKREPEKGTTIVSIDTAYSVKKTADYSAASVWRAHEGKYFLLYVWRERCEYPRLKRVVEELCEGWNPEAVVIEEKASGQSLLQSLQLETSLPVVGFQVDTDKVSRAHSVTALFESGRVYFPQLDAAPWLPAFLHELELFPTGAHDDMVDTVTMGLAYLRKQQYTGGLTLVERLKVKGEAWLRGDFTPKKKSSSGNGKPTSKETAVPTACLHCGSHDLESCGTGPSTRLHCRSCGQYSWGELYQYPCPKCGNLFTTQIGQVERRCHCGHQFFPGVEPREAEPLGCKPGCPAFVKQWAGGRIMCGNCHGYHTTAPAVMGATFAQYEARRNRFWS